MILLKGTSDFVITLLKTFQWCSLSLRLKPNNCLRGPTQSPLPFLLDFIYYSHSPSVPVSLLIPKQTRHYPPQGLCICCLPLPGILFPRQLNMACFLTSFRSLFKMACFPWGLLWPSYLKLLPHHPISLLCFFPIALTNIWDTIYIHYLFTECLTPLAHKLYDSRDFWLFCSQLSPVPRTQSTHRRL